MVLARCRRPAAFACVLASWLADVTLILVVLYALGLPVHIEAALLVIFAANFSPAAPQGAAQTTQAAAAPDLPASPKGSDVVDAADAFLATLSQEQRVGPSVRRRALLRSWNPKCVLAIGRLLSEIP